MILKIKITSLIILLSIGTLVIGGILMIGFFIHTSDMSNFDRRDLAKKLLLPYNTISKQDEIITSQENYLKEFYENIPLLDKAFKQNYEIVKTKKLESVKLKNDYTLLKYKLTDGFYSGINNIYPGSGFIDSHLEKIIILSAFKRLMRADRKM